MKLSDKSILFAIGFELKVYSVLIKTVNTFD